MHRMVSLKVFLILASCCQLCFPFHRHTGTWSYTQRFANSLSNLQQVASRTALNDAKHPEISSVRSSTLKSIMANAMALTAALAVLPTVANARQGAFEMDVEYYLKTVASRAQGKPDATIDAKTAKPAFASARVINKDLADGVAAIVVEEISRLCKTPVTEINAKIGAQLALYLPYFKEFVPIKTENNSDQYYFDITLYASYLVAAQFIPKSTDRVILRKAVGDGVLDLLMKKKLITGSGDTKSLSVPDNLRPSTGTL